MALGQLWPSSGAVEVSVWYENTAHNHMTSQITLNLWSCVLILFVLGTRGQAIRQGFVMIPDFICRQGTLPEAFSRRC